MEDVGRWIAERRVAALAGLLAVACTSASAQTAGDFYRGRTINLVVSTSVGAPRQMCPSSPFVAR